MPLSYLDASRITAAKQTITDPTQPPKGYKKSGYGRWASSYMIQVDGQPTWYRVYTICYSNVASHYILARGERLYITSAGGDAIRHRTFN